ncbi:MAG TPA: cytochrome c oxidase assembly factor Coa1 family protein [Caulobacteraceae bacterium]|nr:cytochrome c oxidase assembly factor Coa1 family protein [Caulobacteraceae bacterium]
MDFAAAQYGLASALASALLHSLWQGALLAAAAALTLRALARASAGLRHDVAMAFLAAMLLAPAAQFLRFWGDPAGQAEDGLLGAMTAPRIDPRADVFVQESSPLAMALVLVWLAGAALMLARHLGALRTLRAMERAPFEPLPPRWLRRLGELRAALGIAREVAVRLSAEVAAPCTARLARPVIWLPLSLLARAPVEQMEALLAHELAHIARRDWLWNGIQCAIESLLFFHPAVWWLGRRIRQEREHACDDLAVAACGDAIALAEALAALECDRRPRLVLAAGGGSLLRRIARLLTAPPSRGRWGALSVLGALSAAGVLVLAQVVMTGGGLPDLEVRASTEGALGPGDFREIRANGLDTPRFYRASIDAQGRLTEVYREGGRVRPIDAEARRWIDGVSRMSLAPLPTMTARLAPLAPMPVFGATAEDRALLALIAAHPDVRARLGEGAVPTPRPLNGNLRSHGADRASGDADIRIEMSGPRGRAEVAVKADRRGRVWTLRSLAVR